MFILGKYEIELKYNNGVHQTFEFDNFIKAKKQFNDFINCVKPLKAILMDYMGHRIIEATYNIKDRKYTYEKERGF